MFIRPCEGRITSYFSEARVDPISGVLKPHKGIDFGSDGSFTIKASENGTVTRAKVIGGYGNTITIAHVVKGNKYETLYAHLQTILVKVGQVVKQGQPIGIKGTTGNSTGIHLHFEIHKPVYAAGQPHAVNPLHNIVDSDVEVVQKLLVVIGYNVVVDGIAGPLTETAIKLFQKSNGLTADGIAGVATISALNKAIELKKEEKKVSEQKLTEGQEAIRQEAMRLKITDGNDPFKNVNQFYSWSVAVPLAQKVEALEKRIMELEKIKTR